MVVVAQLVRAPDCGSGGRRFEPGLPPFLELLRKLRSFFCFSNVEVGGDKIITMFIQLLFDFLLLG